VEPLATDAEIDQYDYAYPPEAVAQEPAAQRDGARLLTVRPLPGGGTDLIDGFVHQLPRWLRPGDLLVLNEARVRPARLTAHRTSGGRVSVLVLEADGRSATVLLGSRATLAEGEQLILPGARWRIGRRLDDGRFEVQSETEDIGALVERIGRMPLPPYIRRDPAADRRDAIDRERYQTSFAVGSVGTAVAAPTAGLHFTSGLLAAVEALGVRIARLRLDVGWGTFRPVRCQRLQDHVMHVEHYEIGDGLAALHAGTRAAGGRVVAVGTTVVRALESAFDADRGGLVAGPGATQLFIRPGHRFRAVDALLTNFHQPRSTLLVLVSAFAGPSVVQAAYEHAIARGYRLFSYGDATLFEGPDASGSGR